ncbi:peptidoglycan-binding protein [Nocardiopsis alba]|uniref:peptidoglycan-binding domain-containing protein n=1 Tax=Nocardiopsis alba TaxID=53437 RepID=UPI003687897B
MSSVRSILNQQKAINGIGYSPKLVEDGIWGPKTNTGIRWAQSKIGVKVDGLWGTDTETAYQAYLKRSNTSTGITIPSGTPVLRKGHTGTRVRQLQRALIKSGEKLPKYQDDGSFGTETQNALKSFQRKAGITVDGAYGPKSAAALRKRVK